MDPGPSPAMDICRHAGYHDCIDISLSHTVAGDPLVTEYSAHEDGQLSDGNSDSATPNERKDDQMKHKVKLTVIDKKLYPELQEEYCADPNSGPCSVYNVGDEFIFERSEDRDDFWHMGLDTLVKTDADPETVAGGPCMPHCSELWDAISRYIYTGLQGGSIMKGWMKEENVMIACCSDGTRPVIFKIERIDYE